MSDKPETDSCKDVAADLREDARQIRRVREISMRMAPQPTLRGRFLDEIFDAYANRMDAIMRERERIGNSAVLYKTLREIRDDILDMIREHRSEDPDSYAHGLLLSIGGACDIALQEPPRNCDRFANLDDARDAFIKIEELPEGNDDVQMREWFRRFAKWSYLIVAKKKGGAK